MKTLTFPLLALLTIASSLFADDFSAQPRRNPGDFYIRTTASSSQFWGNWIYWTGLEAGCKVTNHWGIGAAFNSVLGDAKPRDVRTDFGTFSTYSYQTKAYAGAVLSYTGLTKADWHPIVSVLVGEGWSGWEQPPLVAGHSVHRERFGIIEPCFRIEADATRVLNVSAGVGYMYTWGSGQWNSDQLPENLSLSLGFGLNMP